MKKTFLALLLSSTLVFSNTLLAEENSNKISAKTTALSAELPIVNAELTFAPNVPKPITRKTLARVVVNLTALEKVDEIATGVKTKFWTFNGGVPGPFIRVREGDQVEVHLSNSANARMPHALDFHSSAAPEGGAQASLTNPGETTTFAFKALTPGLYLYHCGADPVALHIGKGMYGLMLVEPKDGLSPVDKEFYIMQSELYLSEGKNKQDIYIFDMNKAEYELPDYVVFNGKVNSMMGDNALKTKTGEKIRLYLGNAGPNKISSFHVIGKNFDTVYVEGGSLQNHHVQTALIPSGSALMAELKIDVPGQYPFIDHSIFRALKGAKGMFVVEGPENPEVFQGKIKTEKYTETNKDADVDTGYSH
ncbi:copper-containing nitrite reductase [Pasteurella bettyae]|uniref:Copper-containing nitrite reductase n=1 Tax=Pasteurella bettyae CCUG 2042 TaxID=1095749 RepID=I3DEN2_9PAST|nr:copper-containing nitrite reductase [Pasteurella bettyae]EIJ70175.1 nitrite reductase, copper-dependent [Pasteurella bettyae CCUG 2042]SUB21967.1 multicopper oxidase protein [Pasteurella bettyae]